MMMPIQQLEEKDKHFETIANYRSKLRKYNLHNKPLLIIEVFIGENDEKDNIIVFNGDDPKILATQFCKKHNILESLNMLEDLIV